MNHFKICSLIFAFLGILVSRCHSTNSIEGDTTLEDFRSYWENILSSEITPKRTEALSQVIARGFIAALLRNLESNADAILYLNTEKEFADLKGFPLFPNLPADICVNAGRNWSLTLPGFRYYHEMLSDFQLIGLDSLVDSVDIYVNISDPELPIFLSWTLESPLIQILGDNRFELELADLSAIFQATNNLYEVKDHFIRLFVAGDILPLNETMAFHELDFSFGSSNVTWIADFLINITGFPPMEGRPDLGPIINLIEKFWDGIKGPILGNATLLINNIVEDCSVIMLLTGNGTDCLNFTLPGVPTTSQENYDYSDILAFQEMFDILTEDRDDRGYQQCRVTPTEETTTAETTTENKNHVGVLSPETVSVFGTSLLMYLISRFVAA